jgi:hypothetical protein
MADWLNDLTDAVRRDEPLLCDGCGKRSWKRADMLEAWFPRFSTELNGVTIAPLTLGWVGPCCAALASEHQP